MSDKENKKKEGEDNNRDDRNPNDPRDPKMVAARIFGAVAGAGLALAATALVQKHRFDQSRKNDPNKRGPKRK